MKSIIVQLHSIYRFTFNILLNLNLKFDPKTFNLKVSGIEGGSCCVGLGQESPGTTSYE